MITVRRDQFLDEGKPVRLAGSHTWNTLQPFNGQTTELDSLTGNFTRLWTVETTGVIPGASPWGSKTAGLMRVGLTPWKADGSLRGAYYDRLETVVKQADERDMIVGVCLFDHAFTAYMPEGWKRHPLNGLGPSDPSRVHTKGNWNSYQRAHVKRVAQTLKPYGNVIAEVGNELHRNSVGWFQAQVVKWWRKFSGKPIGTSYASGVWQDQDWLKRTGADYIVPGNAARSGGVRKLDGFSGPQVLDTDHGWALSSNVAGLRTAWEQGRSLWLMDGMDGAILRNQQNLAPDRAFIAGLV